jgi:hypothetical protein
MEKYDCWSFGQRENDINWNITTDKGYYNVWSLDYDFNQWYHLVLMYDGSNISIFKDGRLYIKAEASGMIKRNNNKVYISRYNFGGDYYLDGTVDDIRVYNRILTEAEICSLFNDIGL